VPSPINIFSSLAESVGYKLSLSPAGRTCEQIISAVGGLKMIGIVTRSPELLRFIDRRVYVLLRLTRQLTLQVFGYSDSKEQINLTRRPISGRVLD
jgi:hypothetical protein